MSSEPVQSHPSHVSHELKCLEIEGTGCQRKFWGIRDLSSRITKQPKQKVCMASGVVLASPFFKAC